MNRCGMCFVALLLSFLLVTPSMAQVGRGRFGIGLSLAGNTLQSDWKSSDPGLGASVDASYSIRDEWSLVSSFGMNSYSGKDAGNQTVLSSVFYGNVGLSYDFLRDKPLNPFLFANVGLAFYAPRIENGGALFSGVHQMWDLSFGGGVGVDYFIDESWSVIVTAGAGKITNDQIDGYKAGAPNDIFGQVSVGVRYYLFDRSTVEKIVDSVRR